MIYRWFDGHQGSQRAFSYKRRRGALCLRFAMAVPLAVGPMLAGLTPGGITQVAAAGTLDQSQTTSTSGCFGVVAGPNQWAQTFTAGISGTLDQVSLFLAQSGPPNGNLTVQIKTTVGGSPALGLTLTSATVPVTSVPVYPTFRWVSVPLSAPSSAGTQYAIVLSAPTTNFGAYEWGCGTGVDPYPRGDPFVSADGGVSWTGPLPGVDFAFQTFVTPGARCDERDGAGDIEGEHHTDKDDPEHSHKAHFQMSRDNCEDHNGEHVDVQDSDSGTNFHSTHVNSVSFNKAASALTITGTGLDNGVPVSFVAVAVDHGATALDTFSIVLSDGYSNAGHLLDGAITLH
jgi:hypothetical protein